MPESFESSDIPAAWREDATRFLDAGQTMEPADQLDFMAELRGEFGQSVAPLRLPQLRTLASTLESRPEWRVVPTALGKVTDRKASLKPLVESPVYSLLWEHASNGLWTPSDAASFKQPKPEVWPQLWQGKPVIETSDDIFISETARKAGVKPEVRRYGLRYKSPDGRMLSRAKYLGELLRAGDAVLGEDQTVWTFPVMKVAGLAPDRLDYKRPDEMYKRLHYIISPEARLGVQVLHVLAGKPLHPDIVEVTNETVAQLKPNGTHQATCGFTGITRSVNATGNPDHREEFFRLSWWSLHALPDWQLPQGVSGLQPAA